MIKIEVQFVNGAQQFGVPKKATSGAAAFDLVANGMRILERGQPAVIPTGLKVAIPYGYEMQVRPRSGLALKNYLTIANSPGTIDSDYRGEVGVIMCYNGPEENYTINYGERIAQAVIVKLPDVEFVEVDELSSTERGEGGFGSTGTLT